MPISSSAKACIKASEVPITQVEAKPPQARDPAKIAALMSEVEKNPNPALKEERSHRNRPRLGRRRRRPLHAAAHRPLGRDRQ